MLCYCFNVRRAHGHPQFRPFGSQHLLWRSIGGSLGGGGVSVLLTAHPLRFMAAVASVVGAVRGWRWWCCRRRWWVWCGLCVSVPSVLVCRCGGAGWWLGLPWQLVVWVYCLLLSGRVPCGGLWWWWWWRCDLRHWGMCPIILLCGVWRPSVVVRVMVACGAGSAMCRPRSPHMLSEITQTLRSFNRPRPT